MPRARHTGSSYLFNKASEAFSFDKTDDDNEKFLSLALVNGVDKAILPLSLCGFLSKEMYLRSIGGKNANLTRLYSSALEALDKSAYNRNLLMIARAKASFWHKMLPVGDIDKVM